MSKPNNCSTIEDEKNSVVSLQLDNGNVHVHSKSLMRMSAGVEEPRPVSKIVQAGSEPSQLEVSIPDRMNLVYITMLLNGIGNLIPWNSFITIAVPYYVCHKFRTYGQTEFTERGHTYYSRQFLGAMIVASQIPNLLLNMINLFYFAKSGLAARIFSSIAVVTGVVIFTIVFVFIDTTSWMGEFYTITLITIVILSAANGIYQNSLFGIAADLPSKFTAAIMIGNNMCGTIISLIMIAVISGISEPTTIALVYFLISALIVILCGITVIMMKNSTFYTYHIDKAAKLRQAILDEIGEDQEELTFWDKMNDQYFEYIDILYDTWVHYLDIFLVLFVTLSSFPTIQVNVQRSDDFFIGPVFFTQIGTFLNFNVFAMVGALIANWIQWPPPTQLIYFVTARLLFIPFFLFCNYEPDRRRWPVAFESEWVFISGGALMAITSGYFCSLAMMYAPRVVEPSKARSAGMLGAFFLLLGICCGIGMTFGEVYIMTEVGPREPLKRQIPGDICPNMLINETESITNAANELLKDLLNRTFDN